MSTPATSPVTRGVRQCKAKSSRTGQRCKAPAMIGQEVCYHHGGKSLVGPANPAYVHGRRSKLFPARLRERYEQAIADPEYLNLREDLATIDLRIQDLIGRIDIGEAGRTWHALRAARRELRAAQAAGNVEAMMRHLAEEDALIDAGGDWGVWEEIGRMIELKGRTSDRERKRLVDMRQMATIEQMLMLATALGDLVAQHVKDQDALAALSAGIYRLLNRDGVR